MSLGRRKMHHSAANLIVEQPFEQRKWLIKRGKSNRLQFSNAMIMRLKEYFKSLDQDGSATISSSELQDPLILFGLCKNRADVQQLFSVIDFDGSGELQFREFLEVFRRVHCQGKQGKMCMKEKEKEQANKYQEFTKTLLGMHNKLESNISFRLGMSIYRRKNIINALISNNPRHKQEGQSILSKFEEQVKNTPALNSKLNLQKSANHECLPRLPSKPIVVARHRRLRTTAD